MSKEAVKKIVSQIGDDQLMERLGVTEFAVRHAKRDGRFPGFWYDTLDKMCVERGIPCPRDLFNWKAADHEGTAAK